MAKTTVPPSGATVMATPAGDPVPVGAPQVEGRAPVGVQVQVAPCGVERRIGQRIGERRQR